VKINIEFAPLTDCYWTGDATSGQSNTTFTMAFGTLQASLFVDYIYLDTDERRRFAQAAHEYLIEQLQFTGEETTSQVGNKFKLSFNHPTKEIVWTTRRSSAITDATAGTWGKQWFNYTDDFDNSYSPTFLLNTAGAVAENTQNATQTQSAGGMPGIAPGGANGVFVPTSFGPGNNPTSTALLQLNGHDRFSQRDGRYFNLVQPYQHHENVPSQGINVYSFALKPEEHQPSGTCNFSRIDTASLNLTLTANTVTGGTSAAVRVYAVNYNVLRIMSGMGGLAYSN
jgi:hypothetical protein